jgi:outer membrane protein OmpA-like peptidoglycan-associated protein
MSVPRESAPSEESNPSDVGPYRDIPRDTGPGGDFLPDTSQHGDAPRPERPESGESADGRSDNLPNHAERPSLTPEAAPDSQPSEGDRPELPPATGTGDQPAPDQPQPDTPTEVPDPPSPDQPSASTPAGDRPELPPATGTGDQPAADQPQPDPHAEVTDRPSLEQPVASTPKEADRADRPEVGTSQGQQAPTDGQGQVPEAVRLDQQARTENRTDQQSPDRPDLVRAPADREQPNSAAQPGAKAGQEGSERDVIHPPNGVGYATDRHDTDRKVLQGRLDALPAGVQDALKQGGKDVSVQITAGASRSGPASYNQELSAARGQDMAKALRDLGVKADIHVDAVGESNAAKAGALDGTDNPADRKATMQVVGVGQQVPGSSGAGAVTRPTTGDKQTSADSQRTSESQKGPSRGPESNADHKIEPRGKGSDRGIGRLVDPTDKDRSGHGATQAYKWGDPPKGPLPKGVKVEGKEALAKDSWTKGYDKSDAVDTAAGTFSGRLQAGVWGKEEAGVKVSEKGIGPYGETKIGAGVQAVGQWDISKNVSLGATALAGGKAKLGGELGFGPKGITAGAKVEAFAGGSLAVDAKLGNDTVSVGGGVEGMAGIGAKAEFKTEFGWDKTQIGAKLGIALGLGLSVNVNIEFSPKGIAQSVKGAAESVGSAAMDAGESVGSWATGTAESVLKSMSETLGEAAQDALKNPPR